jgi:hypothetical protein
LIIVGLALEEDLASVVDQRLYLVDVSGFLPFHHEGYTDDLGGCWTYKRRVSPGSGEARTGGLEMSVFYVSFVHRKESDNFNSLYRGSPRSPSWDTKRPRVVRHSMSR